MCSHGWVNHHCAEGGHPALDCTDSFRNEPTVSWAYSDTCLKNIGFTTDKFFSSFSDSIKITEIINAIIDEDVDVDAFKAAIDDALSSGFVAHIKLKKPAK